MTLQQAKVLALKVLKQVMEEKLDHNNVQLAQVSRHLPCAIASYSLRCEGGKFLRFASVEAVLTTGTNSYRCRSSRRRATRSCDRTNCRNTLPRSRKTVRLAGLLLRRRLAEQ